MKTDFQNLIKETHVMFREAGKQMRDEGSLILRPKLIFMTKSI